MKFVETDRAPAAIGPYSQGTVTEGKLVYVSGQLPLNMETGELETDVEKGTLAALKNVVAIVEGAGGTKESIAKVNVFVRNMGDFQKINAVYADFFGEHKPARALVEVSGLPKDAVIEIEAVANL